MKSIITLLALALCMGLYSCSSENKDRSTGDDTNMMDTSMMDTSMNDTLDTSGVADTAGVDTMYRNSPATSQ